ncbi:Transposase DDE domain group 1 [Modicisalibacter muralis]|uniref:Transposase DDE domain group 1 n=1 Tax=Modicisalibacter muralis TaxID=119000 RepID=A0A1G9NUS3_9GAMM|nr:transposase [Halomonas muralis]SDL89777.1 Transposase DDE domain group 1 [Halomonas muralis]
MRHDDAAQNQAAGQQAFTLQGLTQAHHADVDPVHGEQLGRHFSGFYDGYCLLPLYVSCDQQLLVSYLRPVYCEVLFNPRAFHNR